MLAIELQSVTKNFRQTSALANVSLQVDQGQRCVLLGCSGAGKTTLLRVVAGLETLDSGSVHIGGADVTRTPPAARSISMVSQDFAVYPQLSVRKNLEAALDRSDCSKVEKQQRIAETLQWFELQNLESHMPCQLSGGQAQRAAFAKAVVSRPRILLLDEPLSQVDSVLKESLLDLIVRSSEKFDVTSLMVTHSPMDAMRVADRIAILHAGRLVDVGTPQQVYNRPKAKNAANLISPMGVNWFDTRSVDMQALEFGPHNPPLQVFFGFRPESAVLDDPEVQSCEGLQFVAATRSLQHLGFAKLLLADWQGNTIRVLAPKNHPPSTKVIFRVAYQDLLWVDQ